MFICICRAVSEGQINELISAGVRDVEGVARACEAGSDCGMCVAKIETLLEHSCPKSKEPEKSFA